MSAATIKEILQSKLVRGLNIGDKVINNKQKIMPFDPKNYDYLLGTPGFSDALLNNHFTLYRGYVTNTNKLVDALKEMVGAGKIGTPEYAELTRRFGWEFNGMRLHELYFGNMSRQGGGGLSENQPLMQSMVRKYGSYDAWEKDFKAVGAMRGIGWTILYHDYKDKELYNVWVNEHDMGHLAGLIPLLVLDVFEHAYILDYGLKRADYIEAFFKSIDWEIVVSRLL